MAAITVYVNRKFLNRSKQLYLKPESDQIIIVEALLGAL